MSSAPTQQAPKPQALKQQALKQRALKPQAPKQQAPGGERGQVTVLAALALCGLLVVALVLAALGQKMVDRAHAQTTADVIALAAAAGGVDAGHRVATANGIRADAVQIQMADPLVRVDISVGNSSASAQAEAAAAQIEGLIPALAAAVARAGQLLGEPLTISSGWRSRTDQEALWANRHANPYPVAVPGTSQHEAGRAIDVHRNQADALAAVAPQLGLCQPLPVSDPIHFIWCAD